MSSYPIGAKWKAVCDKTGKYAFIWLKERHKHHEEWRYVTYYKTGGRELHWADWATSYQMARQNVMGLSHGTRFRRIK